MRSAKAFQCTLLLVAVACLAISPAHAQTNFGEINGTITDPTGNQIPGAKVVLQSLETSTERQTVSNGTGTYVIPTVAPGRYSLTVTAAGFQTYKVSEFPLQSGEARTVDATLSIGTVSETVEVVGQTVAVDKTESTIKTVIQQQEIVEIPLNGRSFSQLMLLSPGVAPVQLGQQGSFQITGGYSPAVNGMRYMMNNYTLDGVENNMRFTNSFATAPPPDALEEFKVASHQSDAASSLAAGANVNLVTKSGTNDIHGAAWDFLRNDKLSANGFFNNYFQNPKLPFRQNQFGFYLGGPIYIPHVMNGRKHSLYFSSYYEGLRFRRSSTTTATVPDQAERGGDFSELLGPVVTTDCLGRQVRQGQLYDPSTSRTNASCPQGVVRDPYPNNVIPSSELNAIAQAYLKFIYPMPNRSGIPNLVLAQSTHKDEDQWGIRVDHNFSDRQMLFGRFSKYNVTQTTPGALPADPSLSVNTGFNGALHYTFVFGPSFVYNFTGGYNRATIPFGNTPLGKDFNTAVGDNFAVPVALGFLPSSQTLNGSRFNSPSYVSYDLANPDDAYQFNNEFQKIKGSHTLSFGFDLLRWRHHVGVQGTSSFAYSPQTTGLPTITATGESFASFLVGLQTSSNYGFAPPQSTHGNIYTGYFGDNWKVTPKFTVNLGLQYVYAAPPTGNATSLMNINLAHTQPLATDFSFAYLWGEKNPITGAPPNASAGIINPDRNNFAPRVGLAYSLFRRTVIRSGFGMFYDYNTNLIQNSIRGFHYPFAVTRSVGGQNLLIPGAYNLSTNPYAPFSPATANLSGTVDLNRRDPYALEWNFGIQQMLTGNLMLEVDYVGTGGRKLVTNIQQNEAPVSPLPVNPRRPWPNTPTSFFLIADIQNSNYNALQVKLERRFASGLTFRNSYSWSKCLDIDSDPNSAVLDYSYNLKYSYGPCTFNIHYVDTADLVYQLPFGRGKKFASSSPALLDGIIGGWQLSGVVTIRSGTNYHVLSGQDSENTGNFIASSTERANIVSPAVPSGFQQDRAHWFNPRAFQVPAFGTLGNLSRDALTGPAFNQFDLAAMKDFKIWETVRLQFRAEFFNAFNHTNFSNPIATLASPLLGQITSSYPARDIQFALKLHW
jgi:hypothetical protein